MQSLLQHFIVFKLDLFTSKTDIKVYVPEMPETWSNDIIQHISVKYY